MSYSVPSGRRSLIWASNTLFRTPFWRCMTQRERSSNKTITGSRSRAALFLPVLNPSTQAKLLSWPAFRPALTRLFSEARTALREMHFLELYDLAPASSSVRNISTRGEASIGDDVMIGGFIIGGTSSAKVMVRAIGPSLAAFGVSGVLPDPVLELHDKDGSLIYRNDNWRTDQAQQIIETAIAPSDESESAIIATLAPGAYTAIVQDAHNVQGVALVEVYMLGQ